MKHYKQPFTGYTQPLLKDSEMIVMEAEGLDILWALHVSMHFELKTFSLKIR